MNNNSVYYYIGYKQLEKWEWQLSQLIKCYSKIIIGWDISTGLIDYNWQVQEGYSGLFYFVCLFDIFLIVHINSICKVR